MWVWIHLAGIFYRFWHLKKESLSKRTNNNNIQTDWIDFNFKCSQQFFALLLECNKSAWLVWFDDPNRGKTIPWTIKSRWILVNNNIRTSYSGGNQLWLLDPFSMHSTKVPPEVARDSVRWQKRKTIDESEMNAWNLPIRLEACRGDSFGWEDTANPDCESDPENPSSPSFQPSIKSAKGARLLVSVIESNKSSKSLVFNNGKKKKKGKKRKDDHVSGKATHTHSDRTNVVRKFGSGDGRSSSIEFTESNWVRPINDGWLPPPPLWPMIREFEHHSRFFFFLLLDRWISIIIAPLPWWIGGHRRHALLD